MKLLLIILIFITLFTAHINCICQGVGFPNTFIRGFGVVIGESQKDSITKFPCNSGEQYISLSTDPGFHLTFTVQGISNLQESKAYIRIFDGDNTNVQILCFISEDSVVVTCPPTTSNQAYFYYYIDKSLSQNLPEFSIIVRAFNTAPGIPTFPTLATPLSNGCYPIAFTVLFLPGYGSSVAHNPENPSNGLACNFGSQSIQLQTEPGYVFQVEFHNIINLNENAAYFDIIDTDRYTTGVEFCTQNNDAQVAACPLSITNKITFKYTVNSNLNYNFPLFDIFVRSVVDPNANSPPFVNTPPPLVIHTLPPQGQITTTSTIQNSPYPDICKPIIFTTTLIKPLDVAYAHNPSYSKNDLIPCNVGNQNVILSAQVGYVLEITFHGVKNLANAQAYFEIFEYPVSGGKIFCSLNKDVNTFSCDVSKTNQVIFDYFINKDRTYNLPEFSISVQSVLDTSYHTPLATESPINQQTLFPGQNTNAPSKTTAHTTTTLSNLQTTTLPPQTTTSLMPTTTANDPNILTTTTNLIPTTKTVVTQHPETDKPCVDLSDNCSVLNLCDNPKYATVMKTNCRKYCKICTSPTPPCVDEAGSTTSCSTLSILCKDPRKYLIN
uniref:ShKT domain-containing protein n=1 Tax=Rhabditophanes sp. KR3021 TaxID=114890 RepID=A0AC35UEU7_9BILA